MVLVNPAKKMRFRTRGGLFHRKKHQALREIPKHIYMMISLDHLSLRCHPRRN